MSRTPAPACRPRDRVAIEHDIDAALLTEQTARDPYPTYHRMREHDPVYWHAASASWYVTSYGLVRDLLVEPSLSARPAGAAEEAASEPAIHRMQQFFTSWMLFSDPPAHTRLRRLVGTGFTRATMESWRSFARCTAEFMAHGLGDGADLAHHYAGPFAARSTCAVLGVPDGDVEQLRLWSAQLLGYLSTPNAEAGPAATAAAALDELSAYLTTVVLPRLGTDDWPTPLYGLRDAPHDTALAVFTQLLTGGIEPVSSCLTSALGAVLDPGAAELRTRVRTPEDVAATAREALRFDAPFHFVSRSNTAPLRVGRHVLPPGSRVVLVGAAANRDPAAFPDPDAFNPARTGPQHLSFGLGLHFCAGAALARVLVEEGVRAALRAPALARPFDLHARRAPNFGGTTWQHMAIKHR